MPARHETTRTRRSELGFIVCQAVHRRCLAGRQESVRDGLGSKHACASRTHEHMKKTRPCEHTGKAKGGRILINSKAQCKNGFENVAAEKTMQSHQTTWETNKRLSLLKLDGATLTRSSLRRKEKTSKPRKCTLTLRAWQAGVRCKIQSNERQTPRKTEDLAMHADVVTLYVLDTHKPAHHTKHG